jgi:hypothetical protein
MGLEEEWLSQIPSKATKQAYAKGIHYLLEFLGLDKPEELKSISKMETRIMQFFQWLQNEKGLSSNSARARIVPVQSFFTYIDRPLKLKHKLPKLHGKIENWKPTLEDLQKIYSLGDIRVKCWMSLSRDVPGRMSDMLRITPEKIEGGEFQLLSKKEGVIGKCYTTEETRTLFRQLVSAKLSLPRTQRGIDKMMDQASRIADMPKRLNQHLWRKIFISKAIDMGISQMIWQILTFKTVPTEQLTYFLNSSQLRTHWEKIVSAIPLQSQGNGRVGTLEEDSKLFAEALWEMAKPIVERKRLEKLANEMQGGQKGTIGLLEMETLPTDPKEGLKLFLKLRKEGDREQ